MDNFLKLPLRIFCNQKPISWKDNKNSVKKTLTKEKTLVKVPRFRIKVVILHPKEKNN